MYNSSVMLFSNVYIDWCTIYYLLHLFACMYVCDRRYAVRAAARARIWRRAVAVWRRQVAPWSSFCPKFIHKLFTFTSLHAWVYNMMGTQLRICLVYFVHPWSTWVLYLCWVAMLVAYTWIMVRDTWYKSYICYFMFFA